MTPFHRSLLLLILAAPLTSQQTWKVHCLGQGGAHFTDIQSAVAAAALGDTILVYRGYSSGCSQGPGPHFTSFTIDKPINLVGMVADTQTYPSGTEPSWSTSQGYLTITGIGAGERVIVSNHAVGSVTPAVMAGMVLSDCQGQVVLDRVFMGGGPWSNVSWEITNCEDVTLRGCQFIQGGAWLRIVNSNVRMSWTSCVSWYPPASSGGYTQPPCGIELVNSTLTLTGSYVEGPRDWTHLVLGPYFSKPAILLDNSTLIAGPGTYVTWYKWVWGTPSFVYQDPRATLFGDTMALPPIPKDIPSTYITWALANDLMATHVVGPEDGFALVMLGDMPHAPTPTPFGDLWIDLRNAMLVDLVHLPASNSGVTSNDYFVPSGAPHGHAFVMQSLMLSPAGEFDLSLPVPFTVAWEYGQLP